VTRRLTLDALPPVARASAAPVTEGVDAAAAADAQAFETAARRLALAEPEHVRVVLGGVVRPLLEELHPDGVDADDVRALVVDAVTAAAPWWPAADPDALVVVVAGALGVHPEVFPPAPDDGDDGGDGAPRDEPAPLPTPDAVTRHALLLVATLLAARGGRLRSYLERSFTELALAETTEQP
jgi:hypothetical protein